MEQLVANLTTHLYRLCLRPSRHIGSPGEAEAVDYLETTFRAIGFMDVKREPFATTGWRFDNMLFLDLDNACQPVPGAMPCYFSRSIQVNDVPVWLTAASLANLTPELVKDRLCIVEFFSDSPDIRGRNGIAEELDRLGAAAAVFISDADYHTPNAPSTKIQRSPLLQTLGTAVVAETGAYYLANNRHHRFFLSIEADTFQHTSYNVVATRPGTGSQHAVFGAHYDSAPLQQGAGDNASGTATLLEVSRLLKDELPDWNLHFVAIGAEEYCKNANLPTGSEAFTNAHQDIKWSFFMDFDDLGQHFALDALHVGRKEVLPTFTSRLPLYPIKQGGDDRSFDRFGIPTLWYNSHPKFKDFHTPLDTINTLDIPRIATIVQDAVQVTKQLCV